MITLWTASDWQGRIIAGTSLALASLAVAAAAHYVLPGLLLVVAVLLVNGYVALRIGGAVRREREQDQAMRMVNEHDPW